MFFFHDIKVDGSLFSGYTVDHLNDHPCFLLHVSLMDTYMLVVMSSCFLLHVSLVDTYMLVVMSFIATIVIMSP